MSYSLKTDSEIMKDLAEKIDIIRRLKGIKDIDLVAKGGTSRVSLNNFRKGKSGISLKTFIKLLRGIGALDRLENLLYTNTEYSPTGQKKLIPSKRVRDKRNIDGLFTWGEDK